MQLYLLINQECNLNCRFCIRGNKKAQSINTIHLQKVISDNDFSNYTLMITGGEPSVNQELVNIIEICSGKFKKICINTNGVSGTWIDEIKKTDIHVQISLDGTSEVHNEIRGTNKDIYSEIICNIKKLNMREIAYNISTTVDKHNYNNVFEMVEQMSSFENMEYWKISPTLPFGCASVDDIISVDEWNILVDYIIENSVVRVKTKKLFPFELLDRFIENGGKASSVIKNCGDVRSKLYVYPDFTVYPCTCLTDFPIGNLLDNKLDEIIESSVAKVFTEYRVSEDSACANCKYLEYCNGGCIGMSYNYFGVLGKGDFRCPLNKK